MLIFQKQLISLGSGITGFAGVLDAVADGEKMNNCPESMVLGAIENKNRGRLEIEATP